MHPIRPIPGLSALALALGLVVPAFADERAPPACTDNGYVKRIRTQYNGAEEFRERRSIATLSDIAEMHFGPSPKRVNQYATSAAYGVTSRYCRAALVLDNGEKDTVYWRMDYLQEGDGHSINYDHCSIRHDTFENHCSDYIAGQ